MIADACGMDEKQINKMELFDRFTILLLRAKVSPQKLMAMDGKKLFIYSVDNGLIGRESCQNQSIGKIKVSGNSALGQIVMKGRPTKINYRFYKENGIWKINLTDLLKMVAPMIKKQQESSGLSEQEFLLRILEASCGTKMDLTKLYAPLRKNNN